jgi:hypothetical protein
MENESGAWVDEEFEGLDLGDPRRDRRTKELLKRPARRRAFQAHAMNGQGPLQWDEVDFKWPSIADKIETDAGRVIPLTPYLASRLLVLKRLNETPPSARQLGRLEARGEKWVAWPWVFASKTSADGQIADPGIAHNAALTAAGFTTRGCSHRPAASFTCSLL